MNVISHRFSSTPLIKRFSPSKHKIDRKIQNKNLKRTFRFMAVHPTETQQ